MQLAKGLLLLLLMYFVAYNLNMKTVRFIMQNLVATGVLALVIIFQPELRRMLEHVAQTRFNKLNIFQSAQEKDSELMGVWDQSIATIASACAELSRTKTGALSSLSGRPSWARSSRPVRWWTPPPASS